MLINWCSVVALKLVFILGVLEIKETVSDKGLRQFRELERSGGGNVAGSVDYVEYPQNDQQLLQHEVANMQELQIMAESRRRKGQLDTDSVRKETQKLNETYSMQNGWPDKNAKYGSVSAVTLDPSGNVVIFHRADRIWNTQSFNVDNTFADQNKGAITGNTLVAFDRISGRVVYEWGKNLFYMPHGLTIDDDFNIWVTDVALHQVMKFPSTNYKIDQKPQLALGDAFKPGVFCKPTAVAIMPSGEFFVSDGYCNARIIKFSKTGERLLQWGKNSFTGKTLVTLPPPNYFSIPHGLTLVPDKGLICVADRENGRVQCFFTENGLYHSQYHSPIVGDRIFSVSYSPVNGGSLFVVNGPPVDTGTFPIKGFLIQMSTGNILGKFGPDRGEFANPHDIVVSKDGNEVYVADLDPDRVYKFVLGTAVNTSNVSKPTVTTDILTSSQALTSSSSSTTLTTLKNKNASELNTEKSATALLIISFICVATIVIFASALVISKRRKRGCMPFGMRNRRHAWDFPNVKPEGFKLGSLLDRKRGFEKLNQDASDEEPNVTTNMLSNQQFA